MSAQDILWLLPMIVLAGGTLLTLLFIAVRRSHRLTFFSTLIVLAISFSTLLLNMDELPHAIGELVLVDRFTMYYQGLILLSAIAVGVFSHIGLQNLYSEKRKEEYYLLLMLATLGASMMVISTHFISFFVSLELLSISLYSLIGYYREQSSAIEAGLKYLILAATSAAFLLFGMALIYTVTGTMYFPELATISPTLTTTSMLIMGAGVGMMLVGIGFKLGVVPFHMWTPDVYEGASSPATMFIATISKGAMVALLLRFFVMADLYRYEKIVWVLTVISILSMLAGNLLALWQNNIKRILAYSSIAHFGYLLIAVIIGKELGIYIATFYITIYIIALLTAFGIITLVSRPATEEVDLKVYEGMYWKRPLLATIFTIVFLSLAGIPLTAGFMSKYFLLMAGASDAQWLLAFILVISSVIGLFYYLRVIVVMMKKSENTIALAERFKVSSLPGILVLVVLGILVIWFGIFPDGLMDVIREFHTSVSYFSVPQ